MRLTFYEAILVFGETYHELKSGLASPFDARMWDWFYMVFTPFLDQEFSNQVFVGFGWGNDENVIDPEEIGGVYGQGFGHLPRAPEPISVNQQSLIKGATAKSKKVILMTHFTFVSYADSICTSQGNTELGDVYCDSFKNYSERNMGTFERWRDVMFQQYLGEERKIQVVLTGHSHRRALYLIQRVDYSGRNSVKTRHFDFATFSSALNGGIRKPWDDDREIEPAIIVSDSGGTIPRYNLDGEFSAWGSDVPSGTLLLFDQSTGKLAEVRAIRAKTCKPRAVVALDYMDIQEGKDVIARFDSDWIPMNQSLPGDLVFHLFLHEELRSRGLFVKSVHLYLIESASLRYNLTMKKLPPKPDAALSEGADFAVAQADIPMFNRILRRQKRGRFIAIHFGAAGVLLDGDEWAFERYSFNDHWCFEFYVDFSIYSPEDSNEPDYVKYMIARSKSRAEFPDFDWRRKVLGGGYK